MRSHPDGHRREIRVLVIDHRPLMLRGQISLIEGQDDMTVLGEAGSVEEAGASLLRSAPDVTIFGNDVSRLAAGVEAVAQIRSTAPMTAVLVLADRPGEIAALDALRAGASGCLLSNCRPEDFLSAVRSVHSGRRAICHEIAEEIAFHGFAERLTSREIEILALVADGLPNTRIAALLCLLADTVKGHLKTIFAKLEVTDRTHAVTVAARRGYIRV